MKPAPAAEVWKLRPDFAGLPDLPPEMEGDLRPFGPDFSFRLIQLTALPFEAIRGAPAGIMICRPSAIQARSLDELAGTL